MPRMSCASFLQTILKKASFFEELARWDIIGADLIDGRLRMSLAHDIRMSPAAQRQLAANEPLSVRDQVNLWLQTQVAVGGSAPPSSSASRWNRSLPESPSANTPSHTP